MNVTSIFKLNDVIILDLTQVLLLHYLALGGIARVGQLQLIQPFLTIFASVILLGEYLSIETIGFAIAVITCVILGKRTQIRAK